MNIFITVLSVFAAFLLVSLTTLVAAFVGARSRRKVRLAIAAVSFFIAATIAGVVWYLLSTISFR